MKRIILHENHLPKVLHEQLALQFPNGIDEEDLVWFQNSRGDMESAVELKSEDVTYLICISLAMREKLEDYEFDDLPKNSFSQSEEE